jgi:hypothetical protein
VVKTDNRLMLMPSDGKGEKADWVSKALGYCIIAGSVVTKIPQVLQISRSGSAEGLSFLTTITELAGYSMSFACHGAMDHPLSAYAEDYALAIQTAVIAYQIRVFNTGRSLPARTLALYTGGYCMLSALLVNIKKIVSPKLATVVLHAMRAASTAIFTFGRIPQVEYWSCLPFIPSYCNSRLPVCVCRFWRTETPSPPDS